MITGAVLGAICGPFISALLYGLRRAGRALTRLIRPHTRSHPMTFHYTDPDGHHLETQPDTNLDGQQVVTICIRGTFARVPIRIPVDRIEELIAGLRDTARQAAGGPR